MRSVDVRESLVQAIRLDLVGPDVDAPASLAAELLDTPPSRWYLTGFLVPLGAASHQKQDEDSGDGLDELADQERGADDAVQPEPPSARRASLPSSIGVSVLLPRDARDLTVGVHWGDYRRQIEAPAEGRTASPARWAREARNEEWTLALPPVTARPVEVEVPGSGGLQIALSVRPVRTGGAKSRSTLPEGTRSVSLFLVNRRPPAPDEQRDEAFAFQAQLTLRSETPFIPRTSPAAQDGDSWDEQVADLQYRDAAEIAVGHGVAAEVVSCADGSCSEVRTCWIPSAEVERVAPSTIEGVELGMEALSNLETPSEARAKLGGILSAYAEWTAAQERLIPSSPETRLETGRELLNNARVVAGRIGKGIAALEDPVVLDAFRIANRAMAAAARRRAAQQERRSPDEVPAPTWRSFQLAFLLMNIPGIVDPRDADRETVDLLFFPTGGGKTEAYLGLAAFTLVLRRLRHPGIGSAGVSVLMRYTLRLLTLDQLARAATLICALEIERERDPRRLGGWPFEIGLWVGSAATPNRMGREGDHDPNTARSKTIAFQNDTRRSSPIPLEECPWCGTRFGQASFTLHPTQKHPTDLHVGCLNRDCDFTRGRRLPILGVDEPIYRRLPCFLIATVDKFAAMPWTGPVGAFFGRVDRADAYGFYGPCDPAGSGRKLDPSGLPPPDLIIQDELHLISGPMGTMVGLYESALDALCSREIEGRTVRPKIVASTATVRRAERQIRALFDRRSVEVFPPPGPDRRDSFFARTILSQETPARLYLGVAAPGRTPKVILLRTYLALLGSAQKAWDAEGGPRNPANPADPYMTLLGYFNSLRELGGSRRIVEDEVTSRLERYAARRRTSELGGPFANRKIAYDVVELTSRVGTGEVADARRRLALPFADKDRVDVAIATNMISVGLDILRLGLMVVLGQPKTSAEYIQATSRVGRDPARPGLVVTLFNVHRPRDRSHYERFGAFHQSFYRTVEAVSVTPFAPRALDRGLAGTVIALARQGHSPLTPPLGAERIIHEREALDFFVDVLARRAESSAGETVNASEKARIGRQVRERCLDLLDEWARLAQQHRDKGVALQYNPMEAGSAIPLLQDFLTAPAEDRAPGFRKFRANRSMRDVEPSVNLWMRTLDGPVADGEDVGGERPAEEG